MLFKSLLAATALAQAAMAAPAVSAVHQQRQEACQAVRVFIARGSTEEYPGRQGKLSDAICEGVAGGCGYEDIIYPATFEDYCNSVGAGVKNGQAQITAYAARCPNTKIVLTGYSQGGHVISDILGGGGGYSQGCVQATTPPFTRDASPGNQIAAALLFGDVRHTPNQPYNTGTAPKNATGIWPRTGEQLRAIDVFTEQLQAWCDADDIACAQGDDAVVHVSYFLKYIPDAATWTKAKL